MPYERRQWVDDDGSGEVGTPFDAAKMNNIEGGVEEALARPMTPGPQGPTGPKGDLGPTGPKGDPGLDGAVGPQGPQGGAGPQGVPGPEGTVGPQGPTGGIGPQGNVGPGGPQGPQGPAGADGRTFNFRGAWAAGTNYVTDDVVHHLGSSWIALAPGAGHEPTVVSTWWDELALAGAPGAEGPQGPAGPAGPQGVPGPDGAVGPQGPQGNLGPQGPQGNLGPQGPQGVQGPAGPEGAQVAARVTPGTRTLNTASVTWTNCKIGAAFDRNDGAFSLDVNGNLVIPTAGWYVVAVNMHHDFYVGYGARRKARLNVNSADAAVNILDDSETGVKDGSFVSNNLVTARYFAAGDVIRLWSYQDGGTGMDVLIDSASIHRVGSGPTGPAGPSGPAGIGTSWTPVKGFATTNVTVATAAGTINSGAALVNGDRVLLPVQTDTKENGIYIWHGAGNALTRATDADESAEFVAGRVVTLDSPGYVADGWSWVYRGQSNPALGVNVLPFVEIEPAGQVRIAELVSSGAAGSSLFFQGIPQIFTHLKVVYALRSTLAGANVGGRCRVNEIADANAYATLSVIHDSGAQYLSQPNDTWADIGVIPGAGAGRASCVAVGEMTFPNYTRTDREIRFMGHQHTDDGVNAMSMKDIASVLPGKFGPVTQIRLSDWSIGGLSALSRATLYGLR